MNLKQRISGVLMPLSSLPGSPCCGDLGSGARRFADFLYRSGQRAWQLLPVNPIDDCFSPYASISTLAADPIYIDLEDLCKQGLLDRSDLESLPEGPKTHAAYNAARDLRMHRLRKAVSRFKEAQGGISLTKYHHAIESFLSNNSWVEYHSLFCALSKHFGTVDWSQWPETAIRHAEPHALVSARNSLHHEIEFQTILQLFFEVQWNELHEYCRSLGIGLIGDIPIYVSKNSVDTWANRKLFQMDKEGQMERIAGVPGDSFNPDGQRWNSPLYDWDAHKNEHYVWWSNRLGKALHRFDAVRLDHFIGFYNYFSMTPEPELADPGHWIPGPADDFFDAMLQVYPSAQLIAEDLGVMNLGVHQLRDKYDFPGINVFQFQFDFRRNTDATAEWKENSLVCSGTHDTDTLAAWYDELLADREREEPFWDFDYLYNMAKSFIPEGVETNSQTILWGIIRKIMSSPGNVAIFPMQDLLGLPTEARMNFPGHADGNWIWRLDESLVTEELEQRLKSWTKEFNRS